MSLKLYFVPQSRSNRVRWMLEEIGAPYELVKLDPSKAETKSEAYKKIHPLGHVPALVDGDQTLIESAAICMYLADKYPEARLAPRPGSPERGEYYQWIVYGMVTMEPAIMPIFYSGMGRRVESADVANARKRFNETAGVLAKHLQNRRFIVGNSFSAADVVIGAICGWANAMHLLNDYPRLQSYAHEMNSRPAAIRSRQ